MYIYTQAAHYVHGHIDLSKRVIWLRPRVLLHKFKVVVIIRERAIKQSSGEQRLPTAPVTRGRSTPKRHGARVTSRKSSNLPLHNQAVPFLWGDRWGQWRSRPRHPLWTTASLGGVEPPTFQLTAPETHHTRCDSGLESSCTHTFLLLPPFVPQTRRLLKALRETVVIVAMWPVQLHRTSTGPHRDV